MAKRRSFTSLKPQNARILGYATIVVGSALLWDGYEAAGKPRPFATKFLPGP